MILLYFLDTDSNIKKTNFVTIQKPQFLGKPPVKKP